MNISEVILEQSLIQNFMELLMPIGLYLTARQEGAGNRTNQNREFSSALIVILIVGSIGLINSSCSDMCLLAVQFIFIAITFFIISDVFNGESFPGYLKVYTTFSILLFPALLFSTNVAKTIAGIGPAKFLSVSFLVPLFALTFFGPLIIRHFHRYTIFSAIIVFVSYMVFVKSGFSIHTILIINLLFSTSISLYAIFLKSFYNFLNNNSKTNVACCNEYLLAGTSAALSVATIFIFLGSILISKSEIKIPPAILTFHGLVLFVIISYYAGQALRNNMLIAGNNLGLRESINRLPAIIFTVTTVMSARTIMIKGVEAAYCLVIAGSVYLAPFIWMNRRRLTKRFFLAGAVAWLPRFRNN